MRFCERFGMSPLEYAAQPADVVARWRHMLSIEAETAENRQRLAALRGPRN